MRQLRNTIDVLSACIVCSIVYVIVRGRGRHLNEYERGYLQGSCSAIKISGEVIKDARAKGLI